MISIKHVLIGICILLLITLGSGCVSQEEKPAPTTTLQELQDYEELDRSGKTCDDCHYKAFNSITTEGGKHNVECTYCHVQHGLKPECSECHDPVHGPQLEDCKKCHDEHAPLTQISGLSGSDFEESCPICHSTEIEDFSDHPSRHADINCIFCHPVHRQKMQCNSCHTPHGRSLTYEDCLDCHPAHAPREIDFPENITRESCALCHEKEETAMVSGNTKHNALDCSFCHPVHKQIPECGECHEPHTPAMSIEDCTQCHPAHYPTGTGIEFPDGIKRGDCVDCHKEIDEILSKSNTKHDDLGCAYCHPKHRLLPTCESCHELPHNKDIHDSYPLCDQCHIISHDVKNIIFNK